MVNVPKLERLFKHLQDYVSKLKTLSEYPEKDFTGDFTRLNSAKYLLQISIETCLGIGNHIISSEKFRAPKDYSDIPRVLYENHIIPEDFMLELQKMARFRNRIVHIYWEVDDTTIYQIIRAHLEDFEKFTHYLAAFL